jgi:hypothetical protein
LELGWGGRGEGCGGQVGAEEGAEVEVHGLVEVGVVNGLCCRVDPAV